MPPLSPSSSLLYNDSVFVAIDLETTGLDPQRDDIIEVGAVKFRGQQPLETFHSLVNPYRPIPEFVKRLTGITDVEVRNAPPFAAISQDLASFISDAPVVGHNVAFDVNFLSRHGLTINSPALDTWDLASVLLPTVADYSLPDLAKLLGVAHPRPHRALDDAQATYGIFVKLLQMFSRLEEPLHAQIRELASRSGWSIGLAIGGTSTSASTRLDLNGLKQRLVCDEVSLVVKGRVPGEDVQVSLLAPGGAFSRSFRGYENRPQQIEMLRSVARAFANGGRLTVEAGTGVGKSMAYLVPAILHAYYTGQKVVISTSTINLQEQIVQKDVPTVLKALESAGLITKGSFRFTTLKGRSNYLCVQRWSRLTRVPTLSSDEARLASKVSVWLQQTSTGERSELNLSGRDQSLWPRVSAEEGSYCSAFTQGICFLAAARQRAEQAGLVIVNHSLLLADIVKGGNSIPQYDYLVIDEAHRLEEEATKQFGWELTQYDFNEGLEKLSRHTGDVRAVLRDLRLSEQLRARGQGAVSQLEAYAPRLREASARLWGYLEAFLSRHNEEGEGRLQLRLARSAKAQPDWIEVEKAWEDLDAAVAEAARLARSLLEWLDDLHDLTFEEGYQTLEGDLRSWIDSQASIREQLTDAVGRPAVGDRVDWISQDDGGSLAIHSAPLDVSHLLKEGLFDQKKAVVLTSATLTTQGSFAYVKGRLGLEDSEELQLGSPFDFKRSALLCIPSDMPNPNDYSYTSRLCDAIAALAEALGGRTMALFTSHASLRASYNVLRPRLEALGIELFGQGVDGPAHKLAREFASNARSVLLGTSSFWEGIDLSGGVLKALVLARLPFNVPTEPVFAARASLFETPFHEYAVPQAVLRFRQGFGRLIRAKSDRGVVVLMDNRVVQRNYGRAFLESIPLCTVSREPISSLPAIVRQWMSS